MKVIPLWNYVVIEPKQRVEVTDAGISLPQTASQFGPQEGTIVEVSSDVTDPRFAVGAYVLFSQHSGSEIKVKNKEFMLVKTSDCVALLDLDEPAA